MRDDNSADDGALATATMPAAKEKMTLYGSDGQLSGDMKPSRRGHIETGEDESTSTSEIPPCKSARRTSGRSIHEQEGKTFPEGTRISIGREEAWDLQMLPVSPEGRFEAEGFPEGEMLEIGAPRDYDMVKRPTTLRGQTKTVEEP